MLQEVIHGEARVNGMDLSVRMLARCAHLAARYPGRVHVLQSNHELAQLTGEAIVKDGQSVVEAFDQGIDFLYGGDADDVRDAMCIYLKALLLAVRTAPTDGNASGMKRRGFAAPSLAVQTAPADGNASKMKRRGFAAPSLATRTAPADGNASGGGASEAGGSGGGGTSGGAVMMLHSLPSPRRIEAFDKAVLGRDPTDEDLAPRGSAYDLVWGRYQNRTIADELADAWGVDAFILGHQPDEMGWQVLGGRCLVITSEHDHGQAVVLDLSRGYDLDALQDGLKPLAAVRTGG